MGREGVTQFCGVSSGEGLVCLEFSALKLKPKTSRVVLKKYILNPLTTVLLFSGIVHCDTGSGRTPTGVVKLLLFSHIPNIFAINILSKTKKIPSLRFIAFYKLFLSEIKIKILINSWHILMIFLDVPSAALLVKPSDFSKWNVLRSCTCWSSFSDTSQ